MIEVEKEEYEQIRELLDKYHESVQGDLNAVIGTTRAMADLCLHLENRVASLTVNMYIFGAISLATIILSIGGLVG